MKRANRFTMLIMFACFCVIAAVGIGVYSQRDHESMRAVLKGHVGPIHAIAFSPDGKILASEGADGTVRLWDVAEARLRNTIPASEKPDWFRPVLAVSPDGSIKAEATKERGGWRYKTVDLVSMPSGRKINSLPGHPDQLNTVAFSPDGGMLATGGGYNDHPAPINPPGDVRLWSVATGALVTTLDGHGGAVSDVAFSPDGKTLASACYDGMIRFWNVANISP